MRRQGASVSGLNVALHRWSPDQPMDGFTVSARESKEQVQMLCDTYANSDYEGRKMIRKMAELATSTPEGVATRKFEP